MEWLTAEQAKKQWANWRWDEVDDDLLKQHGLDENDLLPLWYNIEIELDPFY